MAREDWRDRDEARRARAVREGREDFGQADYSQDYGYDPRRRAGYRAEEDVNMRGDDYGQADYSNDPERRQAYRRRLEDDRDHGRSEPPREERRSWMGGVFGSPREDRSAVRRRGPSDRVLWAVIVERLEDERRLDLRDVEVVVENAEVTLNGTVRYKEDKRRIEDVADVEGVRNVQNNLRVRERGWF